MENTTRRDSKEFPHDERKGKSRIPLFKLTAEKVKKQNIDAKKDSEVTQPFIKRRSSIPKLQRKLSTNNTTENTISKENSLTTDDKYNKDSLENVQDVNKMNVKVVNVSEDTEILVAKEENTPVERKAPTAKQDELLVDANKLTVEPINDFDQIYEDILETVTKVEDLDKVETKFEEIIHDYDENKVKPIDVSKFSLVKQRTQYEIKIPKEVIRRYSLTDQIESTSQSKLKENRNVVDNDIGHLNIKKDDGVVKANLKEKANRCSLIMEEAPKPKYSETIIQDIGATITTTENGAKGVSVDNDCQQNVDIEEIKVSQISFNTSNLHSNKIDDRTNNTEKTTTKSLEQTFEIDAQPDPLITNKSITNPNNNQTFEQTFIEEVNRTIDTRVNNVIETRNIELQETLQHAYKDYNVSKDFKPQQLEINNEIDKNILETAYNISNDDLKYETKSEIIVRTPTTVPVPTERLTLNIDAYNQKESIEIPFESTKALEAKGNPVPATRNISSIRKQQIMIEEIVPINKIQTLEIKPPITSIEITQSQNNDSTNDPITNIDNNLQAHNKENVLKDTKSNSSDDEADIQAKLRLKDELPKGDSKLKRIISLLDSHDEQVQKKNVPIDVPKSPSVLSKISMFEHQSSIEATPKKEILKPKIVDEILKTQPLRNNNNDISVLNQNSEGTNSIDALENRNVQVKEEKVMLVDEKTVQYTANVVDLTEDNVFEKETMYFCFQNDLRTGINGNLARHPYTNEKTPTKQQIIRNNYDKVQIKEPSNKTNTNNQVNRNIIPYTVTENRQELSRNIKNDPSSRIEKTIENLHSSRNEWKLRKEMEIRKIDAEQKVRNRYAREMDRSKSVDADVVLKGKVNRIIDRISSREDLDVKKDFIFEKERPKRKSVLEKIALFEGKRTSTETTPQSDPHKDKMPELQPRLTDEEYRLKIDELKNAKAKYGSFENMMYLNLANGQGMPVIALGTALLDPVLTPHIVSSAIDLGYRAIDSAFIYGNEKAVGEGIRAKIEDGTVERKDLFVINKLWSTFHRPDLVEVACRNSLEAMGLDYFDLYLIHNPISYKEGGDVIPKIANVLQYSEYDYMDAWFAMENLVRKKLVRSIGVSNFNSQQIARVVEKAKIKPVINQVECHPYLTQERLTQFCADRNVVLLCYGVLGSKGTPSELKASNVSAIDDALVTVMAAGLGVTPAQLLVRYQIDSGRGVVVKSSSPSRLWENINALKITLGTTEIDALNALNKNRRTYDYKSLGETHKNYPFKAPF